MLGGPVGERTCNQCSKHKTVLQALHNGLFNPLCHCVHIGSSGSMGIKRCACKCQALLAQVTVCVTEPAVASNWNSCWLEVFVQQSSGCSLLSYFLYPMPLCPPFPACLQHSQRELFQQLLKRSNAVYGSLAELQLLVASSRPGGLRTRP